MHIDLALISGLAGLALAVVAVVVGLTIEEHLSSRRARVEADKVRIRQAGMAAGVGIVPPPAGNRRP